MRAGAHALRGRVDEAQVRAVPVVGARVGRGGRLATRVHDLDVEGLRERALHDGHAGAVPLVGAHDAVGAPVGPVDVRLEHGHGEGVRQRGVAAQHDARVAAVVVGRVHGVGARVHPVHAARRQVQRQPVGPLAHAQQRAPPPPRQRRALDARRRRLPVRPEQVACGHSAVTASSARSLRSIL